MCFKASICKKINVSIICHICKVLWKLYKNARILCTMENFSLHSTQFQISVQSRLNLYISFPIWRHLNSKLHFPLGSINGVVCGVLFPRLSLENKTVKVKVTEGSALFVVAIPYCIDFSREHWWTLVNPLPWGCTAFIWWRLYHQRHLATGWVSCAAGSDVKVTQFRLFIFNIFIDW